MTIRLLLLPGWARALVFTCLCAAGLGLLRVQNVVVIAAVSVGAGAAAAVSTQRSHVAYTEAVEPLSSADRNAAIRALHRGSLPKAPKVRAATTRVGRIYLDSAARSWSMIVVTAPILILLFAAVTVAQIQADLLLAAVPYGVLAVLIAMGTGWCWYQPRVVRRRLDSML